MANEKTTQPVEESLAAEISDKVLGEPAGMTANEAPPVDFKIAPRRIPRVEVTGIEELGMKPAWVYCNDKCSSVPEYQAMGYVIFEIPPNKSVRDYSQFGRAEGTSIRLDDCILMVIPTAIWEQHKRNEAASIEKLEHTIAQMGQSKMLEGLGRLPQDHSPDEVVTKLDFFKEGQIPKGA